MKSNRPELALLRGKTGKSALEQWLAAYAGGDRDRAVRYANVVALFHEKAVPSGTGDRVAYFGTLSPSTRRAYSYAIVELGEFLARKHGRIVPPHDVTRADAEDYVRWLANRSFGLEEEKLRDGDQEERHAIYTIVKELGSATTEQIARALPKKIRDAHPASAGDPLPVELEWFTKELGRMVLHDVLTRTPTMEELRKVHPGAGIIGKGVVVTEDGDNIPLYTFFTYALPKPRPVSRATVALRLAGLSSFWEALADGDGKPLVESNPWTTIKKRVSHGLAREKKEASVRQRVDPLIVSKMLDVADGPSLVDKRNMAMMWFLALMGARVSELIQLRRAPPPPSEQSRWLGWLDTSSDPPVVVVTRKREKRMRLPVPPLVMQSLAQFHAELQRRVAAGGQKKKSARFRQLLEEPDAPLFPPIHFWGSNAPENYEELRPNPYGGQDYRYGLTRHGVLVILQQIARKAGLPEDDVKKVHPHALRHFAATAMAKEGKNLREIQAILGHESVTTTEGYLEEEDSMVALSGQNEVLSYLQRIKRERGGETAPPPAGPAEPAKAAVVEAKRPIDTIGVPVREPAPEAPESLPDHVLPRAPDVQEPAIRAERAAGGGLIGIDGEPAPVEAKEDRDGVSPGGQEWVYDAMRTTPEERAEGKTGQVELIHWWRRPADRWVSRHYGALPKFFGIGDSSVLVWFAKGSPRADGAVIATFDDPETGKQKPIGFSPIPVLSPSQVYPEITIPGGDFLEQLEVLESDYLNGNPEKGIQPSPTRYFGLQRWFAFMAYASANFQKNTRDKYEWTPFDSDAVIGRNVHAHADWYLVKWFEENAHTYKTTVKMFREVGRGEAVEIIEQLEPAMYEAVAISEPVPEWFAFDDPVREIYDRDSSEYRSFESWLMNLTGQRMNRERVRDVKEQVTYAVDDLDARIDQARDKLGIYYEMLAALHLAEKGDKDDEGNIITPPDLDQARFYRKVLGLGKRAEPRARGGPAPKGGGLIDELAALGIPDPESFEDLPKDTDRRVQAIIEKVYGDQKPEQSEKNVLQSALFSEENLRIDQRAHTIKHTEEFREQFASRFDGLDSECVMRRVARAMWEHFNRNGPFADTNKKRSDQYALLYAVMISYMAWIYPCGHAIDDRLAKELKRKVGQADKKELLKRIARRVKLSFLADELKREKDPELRKYIESVRSVEDAKEKDDPLDDMSKADAARLKDLLEAGLFQETSLEAALAEELGEEGGMAVRKARANRRRVEVKPQLRYNANARHRAMGYLANAREAMPSTLRMIAAMTKR